MTPLLDAIVTLELPAGQSPPGSPRDLDRWVAAVSAVRSRALDCIRPVENRRDYYANPVLHVALDAASLARARGCEGVISIVENRTLRVNVAQSVPLVGADVALGSYGVDGGGTAVAIIDTGVDYTHADVGGCLGGACKVAYGYDFGDDDGDPSDCHGHGTNVAAIAAGNSGVAPGADILAYKVFADSGCSSTTDAVIAAALDDVVLYASTYNVVAVNLSLGTYDYRTSSTCSGTGTATETAVNTAWSAGLLLVAAAGNDGDEESVSFPACLRRVMAVANSYDAAAGSSSYCTDSSCASYCTDGSPGADSLNCSSNGGNLVDLAAPGTTIVAGGETMAGTSQASPHVVGAAAILAQRVPGAEPGSLADWLVRSDSVVSDTRGATTYDYPRLDLPTILAGHPDDLSVSDLYLDGDGIIERGEAEGIVVELANSGPGDLEDVSLVVTSTDPELVFDGAAAVAGSVPSNGTLLVSPVPFSVLDTCAADHNAEITVAVTADGQVQAETVTVAVYCTEAPVDT
ncbi:MAG: S8 family serine peptidase, partial [Deltaproteobacteria bacterium]|nr:S8 family serine peptidase [Deltaproteobacteria bacterium]